MCVGVGSEGTGGRNVGEGRDSWTRTLFPGHAPTNMMLAITLHLMSDMTKGTSHTENNARMSHVVPFSSRAWT